VQFFATEYVPVTVPVTIFPSLLFVPVPLTFPLPSAVNWATRALGVPSPPNPEETDPYTPLSVASEQLAADAEPTAKMATKSKTIELILRKFIDFSTRCEDCVIRFDELCRSCDETIQSVRSVGALASGGVRLNWRKLRFGEAREVAEEFYYCSTGAAKKNDRRQVFQRA
jgi:hypothetical protein